jgi:tripeptide aminopeptidase
MSSKRKNTGVDKAFTITDDEVIIDMPKEAPVKVEQSKLTKFKVKPHPSDIKLLREMFSIYSPSGDEHAMVAYVSNYLTAHEIEHKIDSAGNIYFKNHIEGNDRVIVNAHMDTVANAVADVGIFKTADDVVFRSKNNQVIGGDDKCGVFAVLKLMTDRNFQIPLTGLLTVAEETGCNGVRHAMSHHIDYFANCIFWVTVDRRGNDEIVTTNSDYQLSSDDIITMLDSLDVNWSTATGSISDVSEGVSSLNINGINLAAGYYNAHSGSEYVSFKDLTNSVAFLKQTLIPTMQRYLSEHPDQVEYKPTTAHSQYGWGAYNNYSGYTKKIQNGITYYSSNDEDDDWDILDEAEDKLCLVIDEVEKMEGWMVLDELHDVHTELTKSKKSIRMLDAMLLHKDEMTAIGRYITVRRDGNDALVDIKSLEDYSSLYEYGEGDWY